MSIRVYHSNHYFRNMILVTGGTGLVGAHLLYHLSLKNDRVRAIHRKNSDLNAVKKVFELYTADANVLFEKVRWVEADLNDVPELENAFVDITHVYHSAALISFDSSDYQKMRRVNIDGTTNIVNLCIANHIKKLCFVSSVAAIENETEGEVMDESDNWSNSTDKSGYAITKYGAEMEVWRASQEGIPVVIVNPGVIIGSGFWKKGSGRLFTKVQDGMKFYTDGITGFIGVKDVVGAMIQLMDSDIINERYILISENVSYKSMLFMIADALNKDRPRIRISKFMSEVIWRLAYLKSKITLSPPLMTKRTAKSSLSNYPYTAKKIISELNIEFSPLQDCIQETALDFKGGLK